VIWVKAFKASKIKGSQGSYQEIILIAAFFLAFYSNAARIFSLP